MTFGKRSLGQPRKDASQTIREHSAQWWHTSQATCRNAHASEALSSHRASSLASFGQGKPHQRTLFRATVLAQMNEAQFAISASSAVPFSTDVLADQSRAGDEFAWVGHPWWNKASRFLHVMSPAAPECKLCSGRADS